MQRQQLQQQTNGQNNMRAQIAGLYDLEETLGSGHFAVVKLARHAFTGEKVAVKVIDKAKLDEVSKAHLYQEVRCMKLVQHPNVVKLYQVIDTQTKLYLILELGDGGDLYDYIMRHESGLSEVLARDYFRQIVRAISYCHQLHVVHRDLKPENVLFFEKVGVVKLTDFGFSNKFSPGQKLETSCGSLAYSAPEILLGDSYDAPAVDVWSLGVILYMLVCGQPPFQEANDSETLTMIMDCKYTMPQHVSPGCKKLINSMLVREPEKRATLEQIAQDAWLCQGAPAQQPENIPLVNCEQLTEEETDSVIQRMVKGKLGTKEEIQEALEKNEYDHITSCYYLLVERMLRSQRESKKRSDLTLPVTSQASIHEDELFEDSTDCNLLMVPGQGLNVPRTPGVELQKGRTRKCSIVQEDEEEDEMGSGREEMSPLNRRGSRSEGRLNIAVADRLIIEAERAKKEQHLQQQAKLHEEKIKAARVGMLDGLSGIKIISTDYSKEKFLGSAGGGMKNRMMMQRKPLDVREHRSNSVDKVMRPLGGVDEIDTKVLTESATVHLPLGASSPFVNPVPKYKTMPSPTRLLSGGANCLMEIFEEATDAGSSDSNTNTPRPILRSQHVGNAGSSHHRRTKFHKSRTTSCSSSDASDDDGTENRKKRANKIIDCAKPLNQRRDSHDDSSDSQDQNNPTASSSGTGNANLMIRCSNNSTTSETVQNQNSGDHGDSNRKNSGGSNETNYRRHRADRRRPVETRLRESQSLNRITEVQECEIALAQAQQKALENQENSEKIVELNNIEDKDDMKENLDRDPPEDNSSQNSDVLIVINEFNSPIPVKSTKPKSFSARLLQNFKKSHHRGPKETPLIALNNNLEVKLSPSNSLTKSGKFKIKKEDDEMAGKALLNNYRAKSETPSSGGQEGSRKIKILGRYFQVHKKICIPLSSLFQKGRLYKTQSCGSIIRDKINQTTINSATLSSSSSSVARHTTRHSTLLEPEYTVGARSDGDINNDGLELSQHNIDCKYIDDEDDFRNERRAIRQNLSN